MLIQLMVRDFALIENIELMLGPGLNVLTGETGAGKSIIVDAMNLLVGERASTDLVRRDAEKAEVEGYFDCNGNRQLEGKLRELGLPTSEDNTLLLSREVFATGRSVCRVNGRAVPLAMYRPFGELLVDLHGQHEHQSLLRVPQHRELLDRYCGEALLKQRDLVGKIFRRMMQLKGECEKQQLSEKEAKRRLDYLQFAITEIDGLEPVPGEEDDLKKKRDRLRYGEKLLVLAQEVFAELKEGDEALIPAMDLLRKAEEKFEEIARIDDETEELSRSMKDILFHMEDLIEKLRSYIEQLDFDPADARMAEERYFALVDLMRKYGDSLAEVCAFREEAAVELEELKFSAENKERLGVEYKKVCEKYDREAKKLSTLRRDGAKSFSDVVVSELYGLGLENASLKIGITELQEPTVTGYDRLEFLFSANPGEEPKPLSKIASGGEMSRVMLALKVILAKNDQIPTLIFDEIDAGVGGLTLMAVADRLAKIAHDKQVVCVTHAAHIAGRGETHFYVEKRFEEGKTKIGVSLLDPNERLQEIVRMLGGSLDEDVTRNHARQILESNRK